MNKTSHDDNLYLRTQTNCRNERNIYTILLHILSQRNLSIWNALKQNRSIYQIQTNTAIHQFLVMDFILGSNRGLWYRGPRSNLIQLETNCTDSALIPAKVNQAPRYRVMGQLSCTRKSKTFCRILPSLHLWGKTRPQAKQSHQGYPRVSRVKTSCRNGTPDIVISVIDVEIMAIRCKL